MTLTIKKHHTKTHYITIEAEGALLTVQACRLLDDNMCGYPESKATYHHTERKNAERTFKRYIKKYE